MRMSGAQMTVRALEELGVDTLFGLPGGTVIPLYDGLYDSSIRHILARHEQGAAHAADGYARASGRVGVCLATSGPGATNLVTGIATANLDSVPLVALTGQVASFAIGSDAFQEADILGATLPLVKHSVQVRSAERIPEILKGAFHIAATGRPGPVLVDIPLDVQRELGDYRMPGQVHFPGYRPETVQDLSRLEEAATAVRGAERPVIFAGGGVLRGRAWESLARFAQTFQIPVATSLLGKGAFPETHPLSLGMVGMHGRPDANHALVSADLVLAVGCRFSDRSTGKRDRFAPLARVIHLDRDPAEIGKNIEPDLWLVGEASLLLDRLFEALAALRPLPRTGWLKQIAGWKTRFPLPHPQGDGAVHPWQVLQTAFDVTSGEALVVTEVGQNQMWAALHYPAIHPGRFLTSGGLGTMGYGLPAAMGAAVARPDLPVFCVAGDGSLLMNIQELDTCARYGLPVKVLLLNNSCLGMVRQWQELFYDHRYSQTLYSRDPDFPKLAEALGGSGFTVDRPEEVRSAIERALATPGPVVVDFRIPQDDKVFPMVPPGGPIDEMILE